MTPPAGLTMRTGEDTSRQKVRVALTSVIAAVGLTATKGVVGWQTGSLGILSEAAHSGLDLVAALITFFAVRVADRPADLDHHYGHGKVENLSALIETALLLLTCLWIIYEALERLFWKPVEIQPSWIAFAVMVGSVVVDFSRSRVLSRVAAASGSQALEADALHFQTDVWGSLTVLGGLGAVWAGGRWGIPWLSLADALAAIAVAGIVLVVGGRLGVRAVDALLDRAPIELVGRIRTAIRGVPGVQGPVDFRARMVGPRVFVDAAVPIDRQTSSKAPMRWWRRSRGASGRWCRKPASSFTRNLTGTRMKAWRTPSGSSRPAMLSVPMTSSSSRPTESGAWISTSKFRGSSASKRHTTSPSGSRPTCAGRFRDWGQCTST